jgi:prevent-host-death family protein
MWVGRDLLTKLVILTIFIADGSFMKTIPLTRAKARLSGLVERLIYQKEHVIITKHGKPVAALIPYEDWEQCAAGAVSGLASVAPPPEDIDSEIDAMVEEIYEARAKSRARKPVL